ncbi:MAG: hypothetical protein J0H31_25835, partial [Alphaproteobacteria bacterium]|nr:hypothetical protein [Alphaproteobacteria bacterium]
MPAQTSKQARLNDILPSLAPRVLLGDVLKKRWSEAAAPFTLLVLCLISAGILVDNYYTYPNLVNNSRAFAEFMIVTMAFTIILLSGGIDISIPANFSLANYVFILLVGYGEMNMALAALLTILLGAGIGLWNGVLVGLLKTRPLVTTMTSLLILAAIGRIIDQQYAMLMAGSYIDNPVFDFIGGGAILGIPTSVLLVIIVAALTHLLMTRTRLGAHIVATGGDRRTALHAGIDIRRMQVIAYTLGGALAACAGIVLAARMQNPSPNVGAGWEISVLAAAVLGGVSLTGGKGSILRAVIGGLTIQVLSNILVRVGVGGASQTMVIGLVTLAAVAFEVRYAKNRARVTDMIFLAPGKRQMEAMTLPSRDQNDAMAVNDELRDSIAYGDLETVSPGDFARDADANIYVSTGEGWILKYTAESYYRRREYWSYTGGRPMGLSFDDDGFLVACVVGRGIFLIDQAGEPTLVTNQSTRTRLSIRDDSRPKVPTMVDIARNGDIYFGEASSRYDFGDWFKDALEGRGNGSLIRYEKATGKTTTILRGLPLCGGVCVGHDGDSVLVSQSWNAAIGRYHI